MRLDDNTMKRDIQIIWMAFAALEEHFSCMGGSARYLGMSVSEIPLYIACSLAENIHSSFRPELYLNPKFMQAAMPVREQVDRDLHVVGSTNERLAVLLEEFLDYIQPKLEPAQRGAEWLHFLEDYRAQRSDSSERHPTASPRSGGRGGWGRHEAMRV